MGTYDTKTILIANQKGGVGKTYIADELCYFCERNDIPYTLRDYDGQGGLRHEPVEHKDPALIIIDTPGALQNNMKEWIRDADMVIVPSLMDSSCIPTLERMIEILQPWQKLGKKVLYALNKWTRYTSTADFEEWFFSKHPNLKTITISESEVVKQAINSGKSVVDYKKRSRSALEANLMCEHIMGMLFN